ncbi:uncharacterized protein N7479_002540, partial [Penicillium vulpinum]|uniref:uncharacterized protein n=1 Tax=Penicillium vulpinum TaxID=29845 RepID=UPI00254964A0
LLAENRKELNRYRNGREPLTESEQSQKGEIKRDIEKFEESFVPTKISGKIIYQTTLKTKRTGKLLKNRQKPYFITPTISLPISLSSTKKPRYNQKYRYSGIYTSRAKKGKNILYLPRIGGRRETTPTRQRINPNLTPYYQQTLSPIGDVGALEEEANLEAGAEVEEDQNPTPPPRFGTDYTITYLSLTLQYPKTVGKSGRARVDPDIPAPYPLIGTVIYLYTPITLDNGVKTYTDLDTGAEYDVVSKEFAYKN